MSKIINTSRERVYSIFPSSINSITIAINPFSRSFTLLTITHSCHGLVRREHSRYNTAALLAKDKDSEDFFPQDCSLIRANIVVRGSVTMITIAACSRSFTGAATRRDLDPISGQYHQFYNTDHKVEAPVPITGVASLPTFESALCLRTPHADRLQTRLNESAFRFRESADE